MILAALAGRSMQDAGYGLPRTYALPRWMDKGCKVSKLYGNGICSHRPCSFIAHISGHGFVSGLLGRGVSLTISPVSRSVQVCPRASSKADPDRL